jgi:hypothetical protein
MGIRTYGACPGYPAQGGKNTDLVSANRDENGTDIIRLTDRMGQTLKWNPDI